MVARIDLVARIELLVYSSDKIQRDAMRKVNATYSEMSQSFVATHCIVEPSDIL